MKFRDINKSMNYLTKRFGTNQKNVATIMAGLISWAKIASITDEERQRVFKYIEDEIRYGLDLTDGQKQILLEQISIEPEKQEVRNFRI